MKGIVLAGGLGKRLDPLTAITNKHLLPVYDRPMIYHPIEMLTKAGVKDILLVVGPNNAGEFMRLLGNGQQFGLSRIDYAYQEKELGIAHALGLAETWVGNQKMCVVLGDNILEKGIRRDLAQFKKQKRGARVILKEVPNAKEYGVAELDGIHIKRIVEKPKRPKSPYAVVGVYMYDPSVFRIIKGLKPSKRGEYEITDVNNVYVKRKQITYGITDGFWADCGASVDAYLAANNLMAKAHAVQKAQRRRR